MKRIYKILLGIVIAVLLVAGVCFGFVWNKLSLLSYDDSSLGGISSEQVKESETSTTENADVDESDVLTEEDVQDLVVLEGEPVIPDWDIFSDDDVVNILLIGTDEHTQDFSENARSDSMMIASINKRTKSAKLVSLERGMGVPVLAGEYEGQYDWLTHIFRYGGADLLLETVRTCFRVDVDRYVRVNLNTLIQIVDSIGGVEISLTQEEADYFAAVHGHEELNCLVPGLNHMNGTQALAYARLRKTDSDWKRVERQRNVIQQVIYGAKGMNLLEINSFADNVLPLIKTNLTKGEIAALILIAPDFVGTTIDQMTIPQAGTYGSMIGMGGRHLFAVDFEANAKILQEFLYADELETDGGSVSLDSNSSSSEMKTVG
mgnify:CR=1 FL=1